MSNNSSDPQISLFLQTGGAPELSPPQNGTVFFGVRHFLYQCGKREGEDGDEKQVSAKKQKRGEVAEEHENKEEINSDYSEQDKKLEVKIANLLSIVVLKNQQMMVAQSLVLTEALMRTMGRWILMRVIVLKKVMKRNKRKRWKFWHCLKEKNPGILQPKTPASLKEKNPASRTIYVRNLSYSVEQAEMEKLFKDCGEVLDIHLHTDREGRFRGFGHVKFSTAEAAEKALELNNTELLKRPIKVCIARDTHNRSNSSNSLHDAERLQSQTVYPKTTAYPKENSAASKSKTICVRNLSYSVERADMENLFKDCGEIVDVRLHTDSEGRFKGFGHVEFAIAEAAQKALQLDNTELLKCRIKVFIAQEKGEYTRKRSLSNPSNSFHEASRVEEKPKSPATRIENNAASKTIYVRNLSYSVKQADMENLFKDCGEIVDVRLHKDRDGRFKGFGHVEFATAEAAQKALELDNTLLLKRPINVLIAQEKGDCTRNRSFSNSSNSFREASVAEEKDMEMFDSASIDKKGPKSPATRKEKIAASKTIRVRNLSYSVEQADMENFFKDCGEIVDIRLHTNHEGWFDGFGHVEFATVEAAQKEVHDYAMENEKCLLISLALELDNTQFLKRFIRVDIAREKGEYIPNRSNLSNLFQKGERFQSHTVSMNNFDTSLVEEKPVKDLGSSGDGGEEIKEKASKSSLESPETPASLKEKNAASKTICVRNLSYRVERADMENLFKHCGEVVDVRLQRDSEGRLRGFGHVEFATAEAAQKALELDNTELLKRPIRIGIAREKVEYTLNISNLSNSNIKSERFQFQTVFVKGFDTSLAEDKLKASLEEHFSSCGEIAWISIPKFRDSGAFKGFAHLYFKGVDSLKKALQLDQTELGGYPLLVEKAKPRRDNQGIYDGRGGGGYQFGVRDGGGHGGGVGWGRSGCSGRH
ncbi:RNA-binding domain superfamily [Sesbania bispinosa]|nr:RNA-binding domain superfamily [Sesbania bispinosa]